MVPTSGVFAVDLIPVEPNTIPLWGPTWCQPDIKWRIDNTKNISNMALTEMSAAIEDWAHHAPGGFTITEAEEGEDADVTLKFRKGGGRIQGTAHQQSDGGCFTNVRIAVSGKAFGLDNPGDQVRSITSQEFGHALGLLHSDNDRDVMFGTVQDDPNTLLSNCDIEAWNAVMEWKINGDSPHPPAVSSVSCGTIPDDPTDPDPTSCVNAIPEGDASAVQFSDISFDIKSKGRFNDLLITVHVTDGSDADISNALVKLNLCRDGRDQPWQFEGSSNQNGEVTFALGKARSDTPYSAFIVNDDQFHTSGELCRVATISSSLVTELAC